MAAPSTAPSELAPGTIVGDKYVVDARLASGGMGTVYRARHRLTGRRVALKCLVTPSAELAQRMQLEARALGAIEHPNVIAVLDVGEHEGAVFLVMELLHGRTLREHVEGRALTAQEAIALLLPAMQGVEAAHRAGLLHRDLKPDNLYVVTDAEGRAADTKVLDFGIARPLRSRVDVGLTRSGAIVGTPRYMAPEQLRGGRELDQRADVFALGLILYEMLAGRPPYSAESYESLVVEVVTQTPPSPRVFSDTIPDDLANVVLRALAKDPRERFADVMSFARALEPFAPGTRFVEPMRMGSTPSFAPPPPSTSPAATVQQRPSGRDRAGSELEGAELAETRPGVVITPRALPDSVAGDSATTDASATRPGAASTARGSTRRWILPAALLAMCGLAAFGWLRHRNGPPRVERDDRTASGATTDARGTPEPVVSATERVVPSLAPTIAAPTLSPDAGATVAPREVQAAAGASGRSRHPDRAISREEPAAATNDPSRPTSRDATATDSSPSVTRPPEARGRAGVLHADDF